MKLTADALKPAPVRFFVFMKVQLLPSTFDENGTASPRQHLSCLVVDDCVAIDAGSLAMAASAAQREQIRDVISL